MSEKIPDNRPATLLEVTAGLLRGSSLSHLDIYKATGCSPWWLSQLRNGKLKDPSVNKVQRLYEFLSGGTLF